MTVQVQQVSDTFSVSPQLSPADVQTLAEQGIKSLICNRPDGEGADQVNVTEIETAATAVGMETVYLPVVSGNFEARDIDAFRAAVERLPSPVHAYCRTGTRSITLWALYQRRLGTPVSQLIADAQRCGYDLSSALQVRSEHRPSDGPDYDIVIVGAGAAGIAVASSLLSRVKDLSIAIIDPAEVHYYQPG